MTKAEQHQRKYGHNMDESLGHGTPPPPLPPVPAGPDPYAGRSKDGASGREFMLLRNIVPDPLQPRKQIDPAEIRQIADSFETHGQLQPIVVEWKPLLGLWQIVEGERRWMAAKQIEAKDPKMDRIACTFIMKEMTPDVRLEKQLIANCLRSDLKPIERANAFKRLMEMKGWTQQQVAEGLHLDQSSVSRAISLLERPQSIQEDVVAGLITPAVAVEIGKLDDPADQIEMAEQVKAKKMNRTEATAAVKKKKASKGKSSPATRASKVAVFRFHGGKGTLEFKKPPTDEQIRAALLAWLDSLSEEKSAAA